MNLGLTVYCMRLFERRPVAEFVFMLGGPLATIFGLVVGLTAWRQGIHSDLLVAWIAISFLLTVLSCAPLSMRVGASRIQNDGARLLALAIHGQQVQVERAGVALTNMQFLVDLLDRVGNHAAADDSRLLVAMMKAVLGNGKAAREILASAETGAIQFSGAGDVAIAKAAIAAAGNADDAEEAIDRAVAECPGNSNAQFSLGIFRLSRRLKRGIDVLPGARELRDYAIDHSRDDWKCMAEVLIFEANPPERLATECRALITRYPRYLRDVSRARLLAFTTERLAAQGAAEEASSFFGDAERAIHETAKAIACRETQAMFVEGAKAPLERVAAAMGRPMPVVVCEEEAVPAIVLPLRRPIFAYVTLVAGAAMAVLAMMAPPAVDMNAPVLVHGTSPWQGAFSTCVLVIMCAALASVLRQERKPLPLLAGLAIAAFGVMSI
jgi:hypothetical protein